MADYHSSQQVAQMLGIPETTITELRTKGLLQTTAKDGRSFLSSQQVYRLRTAVRWARKDKINLPEAFAKVEEGWLAYSGALKD